MYTVFILNVSTPYTAAQCRRNAGSGYDYMQKKIKINTAEKNTIPGR